MLDNWLFEMAIFCAGAATGSFLLYFLIWFYIIRCSRLLKVKHGDKKDDKNIRQSNY